VKHSVDFEDHLSRGTLKSENVFNLVQSFSTGVATNFSWCAAKPLIVKERMQKLLHFYHFGVFLHLGVPPIFFN
jgi:hypothetical protein